MTKKFKQYRYVFLNSSLLLIAVYIAISIAYWNMNPSKWSFDWRLTGGAIFVIGSAILYIMENQKRKSVKGSKEETDDFDDE